MSKAHSFISYPSGYLLIGETVEGAASDAKERYGLAVRTWRETDIAGRFVGTEVLREISDANCLVADISYLNFNVTFEIGYAIGLGKPILLTRLAAVSLHKSEIDEIGVFDTLGYKTYDNRDDLAVLLKSAPEITYAARRCYAGTEPKSACLSDRNETQDGRGNEDHF